MQMLVVELIGPYLSRRDRHNLSLASQGCRAALQQQPWTPTSPFRTFSHQCCPICKLANSVAAPADDVALCIRNIEPIFKGLGYLRTLSLRYRNTTFCGRSIAQLSMLTKLDLKHCFLTQEDCTAVGTMTNLTSLDIRDTVMRASDCAQLIHLKTLQVLHVQANDLHPLKQLTTLHIQLPQVAGSMRARLDGGSLKELANLHTLRIRWLAGAVSWPETVFAPCTRLKVLDLENSPAFNDAHLAHVPEGLESLNIQSCWRVTCDGVGRFRQLKTLYVGNGAGIDRMVRPLNNLQSLILGSFARGFSARGLEQLPALQSVQINGHVSRLVYAVVDQWQNGEHVERVKRQKTHT